MNPSISFVKAQSGWSYPKGIVNITIVPQWNSLYLVKGTFWAIFTNCDAVFMLQIDCDCLQATLKQESACIIDLHKLKTISGLDLTIM